MTIRHTSTFKAFYEQVPVAKPDWGTFETLNFLFRLGFYLYFLQQNNFLIIINEDDYGISHNNKLVDCEINTKKSELELYALVVDKCLNLIENPF